MKKVFAFALVLAMVFALAVPAYADGAIKIGGTGPLTGGAAIYGNAAKNGAEIAVEEINAKGGIQFELRYEDDTHDAFYCLISCFGNKNILFVADYPDS